MEGNPALVGALAVQGLTFAAWAFIAFRALFRLLARMQAQSGAPLPGLRHTRAAPRLFLTDPAFARDRKALAAATLCLFGMIALTSVLMRAG